ncbi:MAG: response regulator transcription factor [Chloroflexaceae bacterium]|nr:response regulator transcription factor [Chloroflexaceae bacterium]
MTTIVLVDDHHMVREGLRAVLNAEPDFEVIGEASDGIAAIQLTERLQPDVLVVDLMIPGLNGLEVTHHIHQYVSQTRIVMLSMHADESYVLAALKNGAHAYVLKESRANDLAFAVREVLAGRHYLSPPISERAIELYVSKAQAQSFDAYETLSAREREVLHLTAEGYSAAEIGKRLSLSPRTVETHRANLMRKLDIHTQTDLIRLLFGAVSSP